MSPELRRLPGGTRKVGSVLQKTDRAEDQSWVRSKQSPTRAPGTGQGHKTPSPAAAPIKSTRVGVQEELLKAAAGASGAKAVNGLAFTSALATVQRTCMASVQEMVDQGFGV